MKKKFDKVVYKLIFTFLILLIIRLIFLDVYKIPSDSMKNTFKTGDYILINKTFYSSPISGFLCYLHVTEQPKVNDIFVFKINKTIPGFFVKRCIGIPGSEFEIDKGAVLINGSPISEPSSVRHFYKIWFNDYKIFKEDLLNNHIDRFENTFKKFSNFIILDLDNAQKEKLGKGIDSISIYNPHNDSDSKNINILEINEGILSYPKIKIPFKGMGIGFNSLCPLIYEQLIINYEDSTFRHLGNFYYVKNKKIDSFTFKQNYYFMLGDNRDIAIDSRRYGLIPQKNLIGKYIFEYRTSEK